MIYLPVQFSGVFFFLHSKDSQFPLIYSSYFSPFYRLIANYLLENMIISIECQQHWLAVVAQLCQGSLFCSVRE